LRKGVVRPSFDSKKINNPIQLRHRASMNLRYEKALIFRLAKVRKLERFGIDINELLF
jgi:hypothetical protein